MASAAIKGPLTSASALSVVTSKILIIEIFLLWLRSCVAHKNREVQQNHSVRKKILEAIKSWETDEYKKDWGLGAQHSSTAYALGFYGQDTAVAVMDSGALLQKHPELAGDRFHTSHASGTYGSTGSRYQKGRCWR